jgi:glycine C-acetyltransferase/8-amino-7-oxononanoate synthase
MTEPEPLQQINRTFVRFKDRKLSYFAGCDYFRLSSHPRVIAALEAGLKKYGLNVAASRLTSGNHALYRELEESIADFFAAEDALLTSGGYITNLVAAQALAGNFSHVLVDERSHPSLGDAARLLDGPVLTFKHREPQDVARAVARCGPGAKLILLTDGMFSHDGSAAPLRDYLHVLPKDAMILVDDAHAAGVLGKTGKGSLEHAGVSRRQIVQTITLSKAVGSYGGAILGMRAIRQRIISRSRIFAGNTPLPLPLANAALEGLRILKTDAGLRRRLFENASYIKEKLNGVVEEQPGPIIPIVPESPKEAARLRNALLAAKIYPSWIKYPGGPESGYFRFVISSEHRRAQLENLANTLLACVSRSLL